MSETAEPLVPEGIWKIAAPLIPHGPKRAQGGGRARIDDRTVLAAITFVLTRGCAWRCLPPDFAVSHQTVHRRFVQWSAIGLWSEIHRTALRSPREAHEIAWAQAVSEAAADRRRSEPTRT